MSYDKLIKNAVDVERRSGRAEAHAANIPVIMDCAKISKWDLADMSHVNVLQGRQ